MNVLRRNLSLMGIALLCATASFAQHVKTDYDRSVDFSQFKTIHGNMSTHKTLCGSIESKQRSSQRWQQKDGPRSNLAGAFPSWGWK